MVRCSVDKHVHKRQQRSELKYNRPHICPQQPITLTSSRCMQSYSDITTRPWTGQSRSASIARPRTAQSRPGTAQATTAATSRYEASFIIALLEGRGIAREVGIAALDRDTGRVMLIQVSCMRTVHLVAHAPDDQNAL